MKKLWMMLALAFAFAPLACGGAEESTSADPITRISSERITDPGFAKEAMPEPAD